MAALAQSDTAVGNKINFECWMVAFGNVEALPLASFELIVFVFEHELS